jgi:hypothetical protein
LGSGLLTQVYTPQCSEDWRQPVENATYLRSQARWCLQMASQMSDAKIAEGLHIKASQYFARAVAIESDVRARMPESPADADAKQP